LRVARALKALARFPEMGLILRAIAQSFRCLAVSACLTSACTFFFGSVIFFYERDDITNGNPAFPTLGYAVWFMAVTFTTVGYGDTTPVTVGGKLIAVTGMGIGLVILALPVVIVGNNFAHAWEEMGEQRVMLNIQIMMLDQGLGSADIMRIFAESDTNGDGIMDYVEFMNIMRKVNIHLTPGEARGIFAVFDDDDDAEVSVKEFCRIVFPDLDIYEIETKSAAMAKSRAKRLHQHAAAVSQAASAVGALNGGNLPDVKQNSDFVAEASRHKGASSDAANAAGCAAAVQDGAPAPKVDSLQALADHLTSTLDSKFGQIGRALDVMDQRLQALEAPQRALDRRVRALEGPALVDGEGAGVLGAGVASQELGSLRV